MGKYNVNTMITYYWEYCWSTIDAQVNVYMFTAFRWPIMITGTHYRTTLIRRESTYLNIKQS